MWGRWWLTATAVTVVMWVFVSGGSSLNRSVTGVGIADGHVVLTTVEWRGREEPRETRWTVADTGSRLRGRTDDPMPPTRTRQCVASNCYRVVPETLAIEQASVVNPSPSANRNPTANPGSAVNHGSAVNPGSAVEQGSDTGVIWSSAWRLPPDVYDDLVDSLPPPAPESLSLVVREAPGGHEVFVANGTDGLLYRSPAGRWTRLGYPAGGEGFYYEPPTRLSNEPIRRGPLIAALLPVLGALLGFAINRRRGRGPRAVVMATTLVGAAIAYGGGRFPDVGMFPGMLYGVPIIIGATLVTTVIAAAVPGRPPAPSPARPSPVHQRLTPDTQPRPAMTPGACRERSMRTDAPPP